MPEARMAIPVAMPPTAAPTDVGISSKPAAFADLPCTWNQMGA